MKLSRWLLIYCLFLLILSQAASARRSLPHFSEAERQWLSEHPVIRVAPDPYFPPIEWFDHSGTFTGIASEYVAIAEKMLGVRFEIVHYESWDDLLAGAQAREVDLLSAAAQSPNRSNYLSFTEPHLVFPGVIITRKDAQDQLTIDDLHGMKVAIVSGYVWHEMVGKEHPEIMIDPVPDIQTGLRKVSFGIADAMVENIATASWGIEREGITNLMISGKTPYTSRLSFASRKDWPELNSILKKTLAAIDSKKKDEIYRRWIRLDSVSVLRQPIFWISLLSVLGAACIIILLVIGWNRSLQRKVEQRTAELNSLLHKLSESEHKFIEMVENANSIILCMDRSGRVTFFNRFAETFFGFSSKEIIGRNVIGAIVPQQSTTGEELVQRMADIGKHPERYASNENENVRKDGSRVWVSWTNKPICDLNGNFSEILCVGNDITPLKAAQEELRKERDFSEAVFRTAGALVCVLDQKGKVVQFNGTCEQISGYRFADIKGLSLWETVIPENERAKVQERFSRLVAGDFPNHGENRWVSRTGEPRLISWHNTALTAPDGTIEYIVAIGTDITEARRAEKRADEALAEAEKRYRFLFEESPAGALIMRSDGIIIDISRSLADALGYAREEIIGNTAARFVAEEDREEQLQRLTRRFRNEQTEQAEVKVKAKNGDIRVILFSAGQAVLYKDGKPDAVLVAGIEITDRKAAETLAKQREQELMHADKMASLGILSSGVAHEINNPNNFIILNADNLRDIWHDADGALDKLNDDGFPITLAGIPWNDVRDEVPRLIDGVSEGAKRIRNIVVNFKDFVRPQSSAMDQRVCLNKVIDAATVIVANLIRKSTDCFELSLDHSLPKTKGNMQKIEQVVINCITNACQALPGRDRAVRITTWGANSSAILEITDEGEGIAPEALKHVFDPFFTTKRDSGGTGLGLAISYTIIKEHNGDLTITSEPGKGTTVRIVLPALTEPSGEVI
ncbi:MAG: PAS domain S-box protein [Chitinivibrionales bacterium]|nr:PAS domain S-box protein [Chitinivibrionales bacterium]